MFALDFTRKEIPFLLSGSGKLSVLAAIPSLDQPIPEEGAPLFSLGFAGGGGQKARLGVDDSVKIGVSASARVELTPVFARDADASARLTQNGLAGYFAEGKHADRAVLALDLGADAAAAATGSFAFSSLSASTEIDAGADGGYAYLRAFRRNEAAGEVLADFFANARLPEQLDRPLQPGEAISLRYGGYLNLSAEVSSGYRLQGTKSISLGSLALSEKYDFSVLGKVGMRAGIAGRFAILMTADEELPDWVRVRVTRHRARSIGVAADVTAGFSNGLAPLPGSADEFLGAVLGVNARNFLNVFRKALEFSEPSKLETHLDGLAKRFIGEFIGKAFDEIDAADLEKFLARVRKIVESQEKLGDSAVALFDRYFNRLDFLRTSLRRILEMPGKDLDPELWEILSQLTGGDPLRFLQGELISGVKQQVEKALDLIDDPSQVHAEIRKVVALAQQQFGIADLFRDLAKIRSVDDLEAIANEKVGEFVTRLVGRTLDSSANLKNALDEVHAVLANLDKFKNKLFESFREVANQSWKLALHAEYSRASEDDALIDLRINAGTPRGIALLQSAGRGDFVAVLATADPEVVHLREGVLTHRTRRESAFQVHITGWHLNYQYEGFDRVITEVEQRLRPTEHGLMIDSTATLEIDKLRKRARRGEEMHVNFLLRALGESAKVVRASSSNTAFLIETLESLTARYQLQFADADTSAPELQDYLAFARELGLDAKGANLAELTPLLPRNAAGNFGKMTACYDVRFGKKSLDALLGLRDLSPVEWENAENGIRAWMRLNLLANYIRNDDLHGIAFAYASPGMFESYRREGGNFQNHSSLSVPVQVPAGFRAPAKVTLNRSEIQTVDTLYRIEESMVRAIEDLKEVLRAKRPVDPRTFEQKLGRFGEAMNRYDAFDQASNRHGVGASTIFLMFDALVRIVAREVQANICMLRLSSEAGGKTVEKIFLSDAAAEG
jgi:hypothetical protein